MRVGIIQSNYLPWRGYFDFIRGVDLFVLHDDLQYTKGDWRNRNRIKTPQGVRWITVPVHYRHTAQRIDETDIDYARDWRREHLNVLRTSFARAPHAAEALALVERAFAADPVTISELNVSLISATCHYLGIGTPLLFSSSLHPQGARTDRLIDILTKVRATTYVTGPSARGYLEEARFDAAGIRLEYKTYDYPPYPQPWGPFEGAVSVVDLIANCGTAAPRFLGSGTPNVPVAA